MKKPNGNLRDQLLKEGIVYYGVASDGTLWENGKPVTAPKVEPAKTTATIIERQTPKVNLAPKPTDPPARKIPQGTGLMRAINANIEAQGGTPIATRAEDEPSQKVKDFELTGLQRAIAANIKAAQRK